MIKDALQKQRTEISLIIYDSPLPPRYLKFSKKFIKALFVVFPITLACILTISFIWGIFPRLKEAKTPSFQNVMNGQENKILSLENEISELKTSLSQMSDKLSTQPISATADEPYLMAIKKPYGMQNFQTQKKVGLTNFEFIPENNKTTLKFQIISTTPEVKVAGHVIVFMVSETGIMAYPLEANAALGQGIKFSAGEPFAVSRLRPTSADFLYQVTGNKVKFYVYIFSREGDLLLIQETDTYKVGQSI